MNTFKRRFVSQIAIAAICALALSFDANAQQSVGQVAKNMASSVNDSMQLVNAMAYLIGGVCVFLGIFKFKQNREDPRSHPLGTAIGVLLAGVLFIFLPEVLSTGSATVWGGNATAVSPTSNTLQIK
jgi:H+/Cl- antiporter ClcA